MTYYVGYKVGVSRWAIIILLLKARSVYLLHSLLHIILQAHQLDIYYVYNIMKIQVSMEWSIESFCTYKGNYLIR